MQCDRVSVHNQQEIVETYEVRQIDAREALRKKRRINWAYCLLAFLAIASGLAVAADEYPASGKPLRIVVPFAAGSGTDNIARTLGQEMSRSMNAAIVIDNRGGANGQIAAEAVAKAAPDGYTLLMGTVSTHSTNPFLVKNLRYDPVKDFAPVALATRNLLALLVNSSSPLKSASDLVAFARANPGKLSFGYANAGGQVSAGMLMQMAKVDMLAVSYKSTPQIMTDIVGGRIDFAFVDYAAAQALVDGKRLKAIAITLRERSNITPGIPAMSETPGFEGFELYSWVGLFAPKGTPRPIVEKLNREALKALSTEGVKTRLVDWGSELSLLSSGEFEQFLERQRTMWKSRIAEMNIPAE